jgi:hypothetical protein
MSMQFDPGVSYRGDNYIYNGLFGLGNDIAKSIVDFQRKRQEEAQQQSKNQVMFDTLTGYKKPDGSSLLTPEEQANFLTGNSDQREGIINGGMVRLAQQFTGKRLELEEAGLGFVPTQSDFDRAHAAGVELVPVGSGRFKAVSTTKTEAFSPTQQQMDDAAARGWKWLPVSRSEGRWVQTNPPGGGADFIKHQTNALSRQVAPFGLTRDDLDTIDADTANVVKYQDASGNQLESSTAELLGNDAYAVGDAAGKPFKIPLPKFKGFIGQRNVLNQMSATGQAPAMAPPSVSNGPSAGSSDSVDPSVALNQARVKIKAGADPAAVRARLQQLGVDPSGL